MLAYPSLFPFFGSLGLFLLFKGAILHNNIISIISLFPLVKNSCAVLNSNLQKVVTGIRIVAFQIGWANTLYFPSVYKL